MTIRTNTRKDTSNFKAEHRDHLISYADVLKEVERRNSGTFTDPSRMWKIDETAVSTEFGKKKKAFGPSARQCGTEKVGMLLRL